MILKASLVTLGLILSISTTYALQAIPEDFLRTTLDDPAGFEFVSNCNGPETSEKKYHEHVAAAMANKIIVSRHADKSKPYIRYGNGSIYCISQSEQGNPILPLSIYDGTIVFEGMSEQDTNTLRSNLSAQLALSGVATALVVHENGNAHIVAYIFARKKPAELYYRSSFLKASEIDLEDYGYVFKANYKNVTTTDRNKGRLYYKSFY